VNASSSSVGTPQAPLRVLTLSTSDVAGGAEAMARNLHRAYLAAGVRAVMAVGTKHTNDPSVIDLAAREPASAWRTTCDALAGAARPFAGKVLGAGALTRAARRWRHPQRTRDQRAGIESWDFPASRAILDLAREPGTVVHAHNLHGDWFDLRLLAELRSIAPVFLTLHDAWLLAGHCAHSFACARWQSGCGQCPDLTIYPPIAADATAENWRRKRDILAASQLHVAAPAHWLMDKVDASILRPAIASAQVIPNGVDLTNYCPGDRGAARRALGLPAGAAVVLASAHMLRHNMWKDPALLRAVIEQAGAALPRREIICVALGESGPTESISGVQFVAATYERDPARLAQWYRAADVFVHPSRMDTQPLVVLESLACGTPVIATDVGGIAETLGSAFDVNTLEACRDGTEAQSGGVLVPADDATTMARALITLLARPPLRAAMSRTALSDARKRFDLTQCAGAYLEWFAMHRNAATGAP